MDNMICEKLEFASYYFKTACMAGILFLSEA